MILMRNHWDYLARLIFERSFYLEVTDKTVRHQILEIRGNRVMLDKDIAAYFGTTTGNLNRAMKRNIKRFPENFCFQLTNEECSRFQIGILNGSRGSNIKYLPYVYTEQGLFQFSNNPCYPSRIPQNGLISGDSTHFLE